MLGDFVERQDGIHRAYLDGDTRHSLDDAGFLILSESPRPALAEFEQTSGTILSHSGEQSCHGATPDQRRGGLEEHIDRGPTEMDFRPLLQRNSVAGLPAFSENHVEVTRRDQSHTALENIALARLADLA